MIAFILFSMAVLLVSVLSCRFYNEMYLLFIPLLSLVSIRFVGFSLKYPLALFFTLFFFVSSALLYRYPEIPVPHGSIALVLLASTVIIVTAEYLSDKNA